MSLPSFLFGFLISTLYGSAFHFWRGGGLGRLALYILLAWAGFWAGQFLAGRMGWTFGSLGPLHLGMATLVSLAFLALGYWLSLVEVARR
jgi:hypothetical protein